MELYLHTSETPWELCKYIIATVKYERKGILKDAKKCPIFCCLNPCIFL